MRPDKNLTDLIFLVKKQPSLLSGIISHSRSKVSEYFTCLIINTHNVILSRRFTVTFNRFDLIIIIGQRQKLYGNIKSWSPILFGK